ncbi:MAG: two-component system nitrogen regulation sensor histidine kinase GlnL [Saprospiraceae bacterium]|jgi:two-component system nitrogen regulation sensor histidine kinase GlnL
MSNHSLIDYLSTAIILLDKLGKVAQVNEATESLLGVGRSQLEGEQLKSLLPANPSFIAEVEKVMSSGIPKAIIEEELHLVRLQQSTWVNANIKTVDTLSDADSSLLIEITQIGLAQQAADERAANQRSQAARNLMRNLSHEIKNPLGGIRGAAQLAQINAPSEGLEEYTDVIIKEVDRVNQLLERLSLVGQILKKETTFIDSLLAHCIKLVESEFSNQVLFELDCDTSLPALSVDPDQITQVMLNLLKNAAHFSQTNETPLVRVSVRLLDDVASPYLEGKKGVQINIEDNGCGVAEMMREQLFFPMTSAREGGTGLGLSISQEIARNHGGLIDHTNTQSGASFTLYLPFDGEMT